MFKVLREMSAFVYIGTEKTIPHQTTNVYLGILHKVKALVYYNYSFTMAVRR